MEFNTILQNIQDVYADHLKLTVAITDSYGNFITTMSRKTPQIEGVSEQLHETFFRKMDQICPPFIHLQRPVLIDSQIFLNQAGLKAFLAPVRVSETETYFIWAGIFIEEGYKQLLNQIEDKIDLLHQINTFDELSFSEVEDKLFIFGKMVQACEKIIKSFAKVKDLENKLNLQIKHTKDLLGNQLMKISTLLEMSKAMFMVYTKKDILLMLADLILQFIPGDFCFVDLADGSAESKINSKIEPHELMENLQFSRSTSTRELKMLHTKYGAVIRYPFYYGNDFLGVITFQLQDPSQINESEVYVSILSMNAATALKQLDRTYTNHSESIEDISSSLENTSFSKILTSREMEVLELLLKGQNNREISQHLFISVHTVKNHLSNIFQKIGVSDRSQLISMFYQLNFVKNND